MKLIFIKAAIAISFLFSMTTHAAQLVCMARIKNAPTRDKAITELIEEAPSIEGVFAIGGPALADGSGKGGSETNGYYTRLIFNHVPTTLDKGSLVILSGYVDGNYFSAKVRVQAIQSNEYRVIIQGNSANRDAQVSGVFAANDDLSTLVFNDGLGSKLELSCQALNR
ncbi:MAG TPA: hypothetical protein VN132_15235 [Bdellovibrio sp.]|nr:hypothetical protein [Bdellovibrio sp.]